METTTENNQEKSQLFKNISFLSLWSSQILTQIALGTFTISVAILSDKGVLHNGLEGSSAGVGIVVFIANLPALILSAVAGVMADIFDRKKIMLLANLSRFVIILLYVILGGWDNLLASYMVILLMSGISQFFVPAEGATIPNIVNKRDILLANSLFSLTMYATYIFGVAGSGQFIKALGERGTFILIGLLFFVATIILFRVNIPKAEHSGKKKYVKLFSSELFHAWKQGFEYLRKNKVMKYALTHVFIIQVAVLTSVTIVFRLGRELFGVESHNIGTVIVLPAALGATTGFLLMNTIIRDRNRFKVINEGVFTVGLGVLLLTVLALLKRFSQTEIPLSFVVSTVAVFVIAMGAPFLVIPASAMIHEQTDEKFRGRVYGIWMAINQTFAAVPAFFFSILVDKILNLYGLMVVATMLIFLYSGILYFVRQKISENE